MKAGELIYWLSRRGIQVSPCPVIPCPHYACPYCPWEGDEMGMINHAQDCGHLAQPVERETCSAFAESVS